MIRIRLSVWLAIGITSLTACLSPLPDPNRRPPLLPLLPEQRTPVWVGECENISSSPKGATFAGPTTEMLVTLLDRSRRFTTVSPSRPAWRVELAIDSMREEVRGESVVYGANDLLIAEREARVALQYRIVDSAGAERAEGLLIGRYEVLSEEPIAIPSEEATLSGSYWNSPYGRATRDALDQLVYVLDDASHR